VRRAFLLAAALLIGGCGVPQQLSKQAEEVHSVAAEGTLLAHEANEGSLEMFTREHAEALRKRLGELRPAIEDDRLAETADAVDAALANLAAHPGDRAAAGRLVPRLEHAAAAAEELAG
jgi:hypothetical protein